MVNIRKFFIVSLIFLIFSNSTKFALADQIKFTGEGIEPTCVVQSKKVARRAALADAYHKAKEYIKSNYVVFGENKKEIANIIEKMSIISETSSPGKYYVIMELDIDEVEKIAKRKVNQNDILVGQNKNDNDKLINQYKPNISKEKENFNNKIKEFSATGDYRLGSRDNREDAEEAALSKAKRKIAEQVGVYVESYSEVNNSTLTTDQIKVISGVVMQIKGEPKVEWLENGLLCLVHVTAVVDTENIDKFIVKILKERN